MSRPPRKEVQPGDSALRFDLAATLLVVVVVVLVLFLTWEIWIPHPFSE
ncbi:MAG TPA: hypothetical protein VNJ04_15845 [Gemmatimonadaceae bacterium]|nr:hypothetical protein [Gemmatimonadaceae bacterium]